MLKVLITIKGYLSKRRFEDSWFEILYLNDDILVEACAPYINKKRSYEVHISIKEDEDSDDVAFIQVSGPVNHINFCPIEGDKLEGLIDVQEFLEIDNIDIIEKLYQYINKYIIITIFIKQ